MEAEHGPAVGVDEDQLAAATRSRELVATQCGAHRCRREPTLQEPRVGRVHLLDRAVQRSRVDQPAGVLDFEDLGQAGAAQKFVIAPRSAPCASFAYFARNPLV